MTRSRFFYAGLMALCVSCIGRSTRVPARTPTADIGPDSAQFVFPTELEAAFEWPRQESGFPVVREYQWSVRWYPVAPNMPPIEIAVDIKDSLDVRQGPLRQLLGDARIQVYELFLNREPTGLRFLRDPELQGSAITVRTEPRAVVLTVRGALAIARLFPQIPDSVELSVPHALGYNDFDIAVRKRR